MNQITPLWNQWPVQTLDQMPLRPLRPFETDGWEETRVRETGSFSDLFLKGIDEEREPAAFTDIFQEAVNAVKETDAEKNELEYLMGTGQLDNPSLLMIASSKAQLSVNLLVALRDKCVQSYQELMRISL